MKIMVSLTLNIVFELLISLGLLLEGVTELSSEESCRDAAIQLNKQWGIKLAQKLESTLRI